MSNTNEVSDNVEAAQRELERKFGSMHQDAADKEAKEGGGDGVPREEGEGEAEAPGGGERGGKAGESKEQKKSIKKDWGLDILVSVGETWIDGLIESDAETTVSPLPAPSSSPCYRLFPHVSGATPDELAAPPWNPQEGDAPLLKLFEFLVASLCLFLIDEDEPIKPRRVEVFELGVPRGGKKRQTWWSVAAVPPGVEAREPVAVEKALNILCRLLDLKMYIGWKVIQLATVRSRPSALPRQQLPCNALASTAARLWNRPPPCPQPALVPPSLRFRSNPPQLSLPPHLRLVLSPSAFLCHCLIRPPSLT